MTTLNVNVAKHKDPFRCSCCRKLREGGHSGAYIEDSIKIGDSIEAINSVIMRSRYNGNSSFWCVECVNKLKKKGINMPNLIMRILISIVVSLVSVMILCLIALTSLHLGFNFPDPGLWILPLPIITFIIAWKFIKV